MSRVHLLKQTWEMVVFLCPFLSEPNPDGGHSPVACWEFSAQPERVTRQPHARDTPGLSSTGTQSLTNCFPLLQGQARSSAPAVWMRLVFVPDPRLSHGKLHTHLNHAGKGCSGRGCWADLKQAHIWGSDCFILTGWPEWMFRGKNINVRTLMLYCPYFIVT